MSDLGGITDKAQRAGRDANQSEWFDHAIRFGLVAYGVVNLLIAWVALQLAFGDHSENASSQGALRELASQPFGDVLIWLVALGMFVLVLWRVLGGRRSATRTRTAASGLRSGCGSLGKAVIYGAVGVTALQIAIGVRVQRQERLGLDDAEADGPPRGSVDRRRRRAGHHRVRHQPDRDGLDRQVRRAPHRRGQERRQRHGVPLVRQDRLLREGDRRRPRRRPVPVRRGHPRPEEVRRPRRRPAASCSSSPSARTCSPPSPSASPATASSASPAPVTCPADFGGAVEVRRPSSSRPLAAGGWSSFEYAVA